MKNFILFFFIICLMFITSCATDEQCRENKTVISNIGFYHITKSLIGNTITSSPLTIDSISIRGLIYNSTSKMYILMDSLLYRNALAKSNVLLPLNKFSSISQFEITFNYKTKDTISVLYEKSDQYLSLDCGCIKVFKLDTVLTTSHFIDSIRITNHIVNTTNAENIHLYK